MYVITTKIQRLDFPCEYEVYVAGERLNVCNCANQAIQFHTKKEAERYLRLRSNNPRYWKIKKITS